MKTSAAGLAAIEQREGRKLNAYLDTRGIWTIGVGHTGRMSPPRVTPGMTIDEAQCAAYLATDLAPVEAVINAKVTVPLSQNEFDALASLGFNIGAAGLARSRVLRQINAGDVAGAADAILDWSKPPSLRGRREAERAQFLTADAPQAALRLANVRAQSLGRKAEAQRRAAATSAAGGAAALVAGTGVATSAAGAHHWHLGLVVLGLVVVGAAIDGLAVLLKRQSAVTLAANASTHLVAAHAAAAAMSAPHA